MKKVTFLLVLFFLSFNLVKAQIISFDFNSSPYLNASSSNANLIISELSLSEGTISTNRTIGTYFTDEPYVEESGGWGQTSEGDAKYFYVDISALTGYRFSISNIAFEAYATGAGPSAISILLNNSSVYSQDMPSATLQTISQGIVGYTQLTQITLKIAGWDNSSRSTSGGGAFRLDNFIIEGLVEEIPPNDSSSTIKATSFVIPNEISSLQNTLLLPVMEFVITDSATADGVNTIVDSLVFRVGTNNDFANWDTIIKEVKLVSTAFTDTILGVIENQNITFNTNGIFEVTEGLANADTCRVLLSLKSSMPNVDGQQFEFLLDSAHIYCNAAGSKVGWGTVTTGSNKLVVQVEATELDVRVEQIPLWQDSTFSIVVNAIDANGNIDIDENGGIQLEHILGNGVLQTVNSLSSNFNNGEVNFGGLNFTKSDTATIQITSDNYSNYIIDSLLVGRYCFYDDFENGNLAKWKNTADWDASSQDSINGIYSLKHNLSGVSGASYISAKFDDANMNHGKMVWRSVLKNGNFDPTSSNSFWYYLMSADSNLTRTNNYGYVVGVNFLGSNDTLSLWKIDSLGNKTLIVETGFNWNENQIVAIEVIRKAPGIWQVGYAENNDFTNLVYTEKVKEQSFTDLLYHGLVFQYTSTRAGLLWCDNIYAGRLNSPPKLIEAQGIANDTVQLVFSEPLTQHEAENIGNYQLSSETDNRISIERAVFNSEFPDKVLVVVNGLKTANYTIIVSNLTDAEGGVMPPDSILFWYEVPAQKHDVVFTEVMFDPWPVVGLPDADYLEIFNRGSNPFNLKDWQLVIDGIVKTFPDTIIEIDEHIIITSSSNTDDFLTYGKTIGIISSTALTNSGKPLKLISKQGIIIDSLFYKPDWITAEEKQDGGWSLERIDPNNFCGAAQNWRAGIDDKGGTPGAQNSIYANNIDTALPKLTSWELQSLTTFTFAFSEELDNSTISNNFFSINPSSGVVDSVVLGEESKIVCVYLSNAIQPNLEYAITLGNAADLCSNVLNDTTLEFLYHPPADFDLVINEIMADPIPSVGLPESDYLEFFNRSQYSINLKGWELWLGDTRKVFSEVEVLPNEYLIVCQSGEVESFAGFGNVVGLLSTTSLPTTGKQVVIKDTSGRVIDSVFYCKNWYQNPDKEDGGWSLERIDPNNFCGAAQNWRAGIDDKGGTPGAQNSIYGQNVDITLPKVLYFKVENESRLVLEFSEGLDLASAKNVNNYSFSHSQLSVDSILVINTEQSKIRLFMNSPFSNGNNYSLQIKNITDLCGNAIADTLFQFRFNYIEKNDIIISEVMVDPSPIVGLPEFEYIELYNNSPKQINIEGWQLVVNGSKKAIPRVNILPDSFLVILSNTAFNEFYFIENKLVLPGFMSLPNQVATIQLLDTTGAEINKVQYNDSWYHDSEKDNGGWSLEIIDPNNQCGGINNWLASNNYLGGTPGGLNSVNANNIDATLPHVVGVLPIVNGTNSNMLVVRFSEIIDKTTVLPNNFIIDEFGQPNMAYADSANLLMVVLIFNENFKQKTHYKLNIKGVGDYCNNILTDTIVEFDFYEPQLYDIVINEIMANPIPSAGLPEVEYIELYNRSQFEVNAYQWAMQVGSSTRKMPYVNIPAQSYLVLCSTENIQQFSADINIAGVENLPGLPLSSTVTLLNSNNEMICQTEYSSLWVIDDFKADGGYSLERIDFNNPNETANNWRESNNENGGTPGFENSIYKNNPDETPPNLLRAFPANDTLIGLQFSKPINYSTITVDMFDIEGEFGLISSFNAEDNNFSIIYLLLSSNLEMGIEYTINVSDEVTDISGNYILQRSVKLVLPIKASPNDIVINELLFNPLDGGVDFIELYNRSAFTVNLKQFYIASFDDAGNIKDPKRVTQNGVLLFPEEYIIVSENSEVVKQQYWVEDAFAFYDMKKLPSFSNSEGSVVLLDTSGVVVDYLYYNDDMHFGLLNSTKGVSLERINFDRPSQEQSNWHSAAEQAGWATPGYKNSMYNKLGNTDKFISIDPEVFSPDNDGYNDILYIHYNFDEPGYVANVTVFDSKGRKVIALSENELMGIEGTISWDGLNYNRQRVPIGIYIISFEIFDLNGNIKKYHRVCAVNARFR